MQRLRVSGAEAPHYLRLDGHHCLHVLKAQANYAMIAPFYPNNPFCREYRYRTGMPMPLDTVLQTQTQQTDKESFRVYVTNRDALRYVT
jgi:hypothetical protein